MNEPMLLKAWGPLWVKPGDWIRDLFPLRCQGPYSYALYRGEKRIRKIPRKVFNQLVVDKKLFFDGRYTDHKGTYDKYVFEKPNTLLTNA